MSQIEKARFKLSTLITGALLVGFVGFGIGINFSSIQNKIVEWRHQSNSELPQDLNYREVEAIYDTLRSKYGGGQLDATKLLEGAKKGLVAAAGDPYTLYLDEEAARQFQEDINGTFSGIGAEIAIKNEQLVVVAPVAGSPAKDAGLRAGDQIIKIDDESTEGMSVDAAVRKIRGDAGSQVRLSIVRGSAQPEEIAITRAVISVPSVTSELKNGNVGVITLSRFDESTSAELGKAAASLKRQGATKFVLDMRDNPGGLLDSAVTIADEFLDSGKVVVEERKDGKALSTERTTAGGELVGMPVVVLINEGSASAAEIVAGALHDNKVATLVGAKTFGKGSVQEIIELNGKTSLKVTVALWYTPDGRNISKEGIEPDVKVELSRDDFNNSRDPQLAKALELLK